MRLFASVVLLCGFADFSPVFAQDSVPYADLGAAYISAGIGNAGIQAAINSHVSSDVRRKAVPSALRPSQFGQVSDGGSATEATVLYRKSGSRTRANLAAFVEKSRAVDPAGAAKMQALFASTDVIGMIDRRMRQTYGMRADNVADAYAVYWTSAWMGSRGRSDDPTPGQMAIVKQQAANALRATPQFAQAGDAAKQEMAEAMLIQAALIGDTIDTYKSDPAMLAKAKAAIAKGARGMGLDLDAMTLTNEGFVPTGRKMGAADPEPVLPGKDGLPAALLVAAGGAGLGGAFLLGRMAKRG